MNRAEREAKHRALHKDGRVVCGEYLICVEIDKPDIGMLSYDIYPRTGMPPLGYDRVARCENFSEALLTVANLEKEES